MTSYGVVVGRFQVPELHMGHIRLFDEVRNKHSRVIVFIGVPKTGTTERNPLDFETRRLMIQTRFPDFMIFPVVDMKSDKDWSDHLDGMIAAASQFSKDITLYAGRGGFIPRYSGRHKTQELFVGATGYSGTRARQSLKDIAIGSYDFRAGAIYSAMNQYKRVIPTVDVAIVHMFPDGIEILLGRKPAEKNFRLIGGFCEPYSSWEANGRREAREETGLEILDMEYIASQPINDWRYRTDPDQQITTSLFLGWAMTPFAKPGDDIAEVEWFHLENLPTLEPEHELLMAKVKDYIERKRHATSISSESA